MKRLFPTRKSENPESDEKNSRPILQWWGVCLSLLLVLGVVGMTAFPVPAASYDPPTPYTTGSSRHGPPDPSLTEIGADGLLNAFRNSIPKAKLMYHGGKLCVEGILVKADRSERGPYLELTARNETESVRCYFGENGPYSEALERIPTGSPLYVTGVCEVTEKEIFLRDCESVEVA